MQGWFNYKALCDINELNKNSYMVISMDTEK